MFLCISQSNYVKQLSAKKLFRVITLALVYFKIIIRYGL